MSSFLSGFSDMFSEPRWPPNIGLLCSESLRSARDTPRAEWTIVEWRAWAEHLEKIGRSHVKELKALRREILPLRPKRVGRPLKSDGRTVLTRFKPAKKVGRPGLNDEAKAARLTFATEVSNAAKKHGVPRRKIIRDFVKQQMPRAKGSELERETVRLAASVANTLSAVRRRDK